MSEQLQEALHRKEALLRRKEVERRTGLPRSTLYDLIGRGEFPAPIKLSSGRSVAWIESEVDRYIAERISDSRRGAA